MRRVGVLGAVVALGLFAIALTSRPASATVLCKTATNPCSGGTYGKGTVIEASLKSGNNSVLDTKIGDLECSGLMTTGETTTSGGKSENVTGFLTTLTFSGCNSTVTTLKNGSFSISSTNGEVKLTMEGFEITVESGEFDCIYSGTATFSLHGGAMASGEGSATISRTGGRSGTSCGTTGRWATDFTITNPEPLFFEEPAAPAALCSNSSNPCTGGTYGKGTLIEASLKASTKWILNTPFGEVHCTEASIKGEVTAAGEEGGPPQAASGTVTALSFGECNCGVKVLQKGKFSIARSSGGIERLTVEELETTTECLTFDCIWRSSSLPTTLSGGAMASFAASASIPRVGGTSGTSCGSSGTLNVEYTVTAPEPLYVTEQDASTTVLCKTATNPCTGGTYGQGTAVEVSLKSGTESVMKSSFIGEVKCKESLIEGEVTEGPKAAVSGAFSSFAFGGCNSEVKVLRSGTFEIASPKEGNGTLKLTGLETTVEILGLHCIFATNHTEIGSFNGGEMASLAAKSASFPRVGGRSGAFCGSAAPWNVEYTVMAPEPLYVERV